MLATKNNHLIIVQKLLQAKASINLCDASGKSAFYISGMLGYVDIGKLLLEYGAYHDIFDHDGMSVLMQALRYHHEEFIELLISLPFNVYAVDKVSFIISDN